MALHHMVLARTMVSKPLFLVQPLAEAPLAHCIACAEKIARIWPLIPIGIPQRL